MRASATRAKAPEQLRRRRTRCVAPKRQHNTLHTFSTTVVTFFTVLLLPSLAVVSIVLAAFHVVASDSCTVHAAFVPAHRQQLLYYL